jgi:hypothetical protein
MIPTVISFYTDDWEYPTHAERLRDECRALGVPHDIRLLDSTRDYHGNCRLKSRYILARLTELKKPVLWIDVDGSLLRSPVELGDLADRYDVGLRPRRVPVEFTWHVGTLWFNYTEPALVLLKDYAGSDAGTDEHMLQSAWLKNQDHVGVYELPPEYFFVINRNNRNNVPANTAIVHRISRSDLKLEAKRRSRKISEEKKKNAQ